MFIIKWVAHQHEGRPVAVENTNERDLSMVVLSCQNRLLGMRKSTLTSHLMASSSAMKPGMNCGDGSGCLAL